MCASNSSGVVSSSVPRVVSPAALTRQSTRPYARDRRRTRGPRLGDVADVGLHEQRLGRRPRVSSATSASPGSRRRPVTATVAPSRAAARAMPAPSPGVPPLTSTTRS